MSTGYSRSPNVLKGALIQFSAPMLIPIPNIIVFQYNPETMTRSLTPWQPSASVADEGTGGSPNFAAAKQTGALAQPYDPKETFSLTLELDAADALESPSTHPVAVVAGVADRISAIEMLCYPPGDSALGGLLNVAVNVSMGSGVTTGASADVLNRKSVPVVLFFWGPGRIVPVRITNVSVEEQQYSPLLFPVRAKVSLDLHVLDADDLINADGKSDQSAAVEIAKACYTFTRAQKEALATANLANSVESIIGMLPV
jgi:hypothetical protein